MSVRSYLYVPADRPERLAKAFTRGADAVIADLEDSVTPDSKDEALLQLRRWLGTLKNTSIPIWVRVNSGDRQEAELQSLAGERAVTGFVLPKVESAEQLSAASSNLRQSDAPKLLAPLIESATGLVEIHSIARAKFVHQLHIGEMDLAADLDLTPGEDGSALLYARSIVVVASRSAGLVAPSAPVSANIDDLPSFEATTSTLRRLGFNGRDCIHPAQVSISNIVMAFSATEAQWASNLLREAESSRGAFRASDGTMVDEAVLRRARQIAQQSS